MRRVLASLICFGHLFCFLLPAKGIPVPKIAPGFAMPDMQRLADDVYVAKVAPDLWVHTTVGKLDDGSLYATNGAIVLDGENSILVDVGWTPEQAEVLLDWARNALKHPVTKAYVTHFHRDKLGGAAALERRGIPVFGIPLTIELARKAKLPVPDHAFQLAFKPVRIGGDAMAMFPGAGHTRDNIVVYFPRDRVLMGGCFIKAGDAADIGNVADADLKAWPVSVGRMQAAFPEARVVIPGHGPMGEDGVRRTLELLR